MAGGGFGCDDYPLTGNGYNGGGAGKCPHVDWEKYTNTCGAWQKCTACGFTKKQEEDSL
jgi:hypothetical protein